MWRFPIREYLYPFPFLIILIYTSLIFDIYKKLPKAFHVTLISSSSNEPTSLYILNVKIILIFYFFSLFLATSSITWWDYNDTFEASDNTLDILF